MNESSHNFVSNSIPGSGQPWRQQYYVNDLQSGDITGWSTGVSLLDFLSNSQTIVTKNRVYLLGGYNGSKWISTVYTAPINDGGTLEEWFIDTQLPDALGYSSAIVTKNRVYLLGGVNNNWVSVPAVYTAPINSDGTLGTWTTEAPLPDALSHSSAIVIKNRVYLLGGYNGSKWISTVYTATINDNGKLGTWSTEASLPGALSDSQAIVTRNRVYLLGGFNGSKWVSTVYTATINNDGSLKGWSTSTPLPSALGYSSSIVTKSQVYLLGGINSYWTYTSTVYTAPINNDGILGEWRIGTPLPDILGKSQAIVIKNKIYLLGGHTGNAWVPTVYTAPIAGGLNDYSAYYS